jgi:thiol-disulfide isomerase/thioredoxin
MNPEITNPQAPPSLDRRRLLYGGVAAAALAAGAGVAWWKRGSQQPMVSAADALWPLEFDTPDGSRLALQAFRGKPLLLNFWATWCPPCVDELPLLDGFYRQQSANGWQVVGLAIDQPSAVRTFLARMPLSFPIGLAGLGGTELSKTMGNQAGGLPFSVVVNAGGEVLHRRMGRVAPADLESWGRVK